MKTFNPLSKYVFLSLLILFDCSSDDEPQPIDCSTSGLTLSFTVSNPSSCNVSDGSITATAVGGASPYEYFLDGKSNDTNNKFVSLGAGNYILKVEDKNGCEKSVNVTITSFNSTLSFTTTTSNSGCKSNNGSITVNATGGTGPYTYQLNSGAQSLSSTYSNLSAGNYSIKVTDNVGCVVTQNLKVTSGVSYSTTIKPIIEAKCAVSGCHVSGGGAPNSFEIFENVQISAAQIKSKTQSGEMPKNGTKLPQDQLDAIACWVDDGALNN